MTILSLNPGDFLLAYPFHTSTAANGSLNRAPIALGRSFGESPRISGLSFFCAYSAFSGLIGDGGLYVGKPVTALGMPMRISGIKLFDYPVHQYYRVEIELTGVHAETGSKVDGKRCHLDDPTFVDPLINSQGYLMLSSLGTYTGVSIQCSFTDATDEEFTTWREQANKYADIYRIFWDYHMINPVAKTWVTGRPNHGEIKALYANPDRAQEIQLGGSGSFLNGVQLARELVNARFEINVEKPPEDVEITLVTNGDAISQAANLGLTNEHFNNAEQCFDKGGITIVEKHITKLNDTIIEEVYYTWGFRYDTMQTHSMDQGESRVWFNPTIFNYVNFWQIVKTETITYNWDINDNYYIGKTTSVLEFVRLLEDPSSDDDNRRIRYMNHLADNTSTNLAYYNLMNFYQHSYAYTETITLDDLQSYYADIPWQQLTSKKNPKPRYVKKRIYQGGYILSAYDPDAYAEENAKDTPDFSKVKKIYKGTKKYECDETEILVPGGRNQLQATPEIYVNSKISYTIEGQDHGRGQGKPETEEVEGRPPTAQRLTSYGRVTGGAIIPDVNNSYLFNTINTGFGVNDPILETISYDGVTSRTTARSIAEHILSIENTFACKVWNFSNVLDVGFDWYPGDLCTHNGETCVIQSIDYQVIFNPTLGAWELLDNQTSMTIGKLMQPSVSILVKFD